MTTPVHPGPDEAARPTVGPDPTTRDAAARLATLETFTGRPARAVWDLARAGRPSLFASSTRAGVPTLGWVHGTNDPAFWGGTDHLGIHSPHPERGPQLVHVATLVAVQLVRLHGPDAVMVIDADPATADTPDHWAPLQEAGVHIRPVAVDPGKAVGDLAALANTVTARHRPGPARRLHPDPRFVVILSGDLVGPLLSAYGLPGYAVAARDALRIITHPDHTTTNVTAVVTASTAPPPNMWAPTGPHRPVTPVWASLEAPAPGTTEWTHTPDPLVRPVPVEVPGMLPPWWLAERLTDDRF